MKNLCAPIVGKTSKGSEVLIVSKRSKDAAKCFLLHLQWLVQEKLLDYPIYQLILEEGFHYSWIINTMIKQKLFSEEAYAFALLARGTQSWRRIADRHGAF